MRLIDADAYAYPGDLSDVPTVDPVFVVKCNDCENWDRDWEPSSGEAGTHFCPLLGIVTDPDFYCKKGERRQDHAE